MAAPAEPRATVPRPEPVESRPTEPEPAPAEPVERRPAEPAPAEPRPAAPEPAAHEPGAVAARAGEPEPPAVAGQAAAGSTDDGESGEDAIHTLLWTAATERPVPEVAALVARLTASGEVSSPADVALRAAAVSRPLDEVRQLIALLNESGYDLHQAETTLRAAAVGRPIEDIVELVNIIGADSSGWRTTGGPEGEAARGTDPGQGAAAERTPAPTLTPPGADKAGSKRLRGALKARSPLDQALATGPGSHAPSTALRSGLRWPAVAALFACGLLHLPTDVAGLRSGGTAAMVSVVITLFCLLVGIVLAVRDSLSAWAAAAAVAVGLIGLHLLAGMRTVDLLTSSLGSRFAWAQALAVLSAAAVIALAAAALLRHTKATGAADST
ncbi:MULTISPECIES: hypothetical protein [unclassified Streptomyces]|uniref:hypothetical protein n=1 Tax=unclassified Streptomyces TaxID=2593676 RepID=UPI0036B591E5